MKSLGHRSGFALTVTLVLIVLIAIIVVAYLVSTRIERSTSSVYANRLRAKIQADSGLAAAIHLLKDNTRYGNYITAMPAPSPTTTPIYTEIYRPTDATTRNIIPDEFLQLNNGGGEVLVSLASPPPSAADAGPDPRPTPPAVPSPPAPFAVPTPSLSAANSYDFNQLVTVSSTTGRLVQPSPSPVPPAYGQWVNVRNTNNELIGRYAFFIEDESMKINVNAVGNNLASPTPTASPNMRINDLAPIPTTTPASQIQEIDPTGVLLSANRRSANTALMAAGASGSRLATKSTIALLSNWLTPTSYAHLLTTLSRDDNTTARGWQRLELNTFVAGANDNATKVAVATKIANWIRDAWTSPTTLMLTLQNAAQTGDTTQIFGDDRLRQQIAANIVDYIDADSTPTDMGDVIPAGYTDAVPVIGIEKIPYLVAIEVLYEASNSTCPTPPVPGTYTATLRLKLQFRFLNLFETALDLANSLGRIEIKGVPVIKKNGIDPAVFDVESQTFTIQLADLILPPPASGSCGTIGVCVVPAGADGTSGSGARTVQTDWLTTQSVTFTVDVTDQNPRLLAGKITAKVFGKNGERLDDTAIVTNLNATGYENSNGNSIKDFLTDASSTALQIASINVAYGYSGNAQAGDPRYRGRLVNDRWRNLDRTDATTPQGWPDTDRITAFKDTAELNPRAYGADWYDEAADRPLAFIRNGPMINIGELGNIAATEYPWRTLYLQHPERPVNTTQTGPKDEIPLRRSQSQDYVLIDLFRTGGNITRDGAINVNTQQQFTKSGATIATLPLQCLFIGLPVGTTKLTEAAPAAPSPSPADRLSTSVNLLVSSATTAPPAGQANGTNPVPYRIESVCNKRAALNGETTVSDNNPVRPYFQIGEVSSTLSRLISASEASDTGASTSRSKVIYSALRSDPQQSSGSVHDNYRKDDVVEQAFREVSNSITTRGNVFRVLYVGQTIKDTNKNGLVDGQNEVMAEYLGEAFVERTAIFQPNPSANPTPAPGTPIKTTDSTYKIVANRVVTE